MPNRPDIHKPNGISWPALSQDAVPGGSTPPALLIELVQRYSVRWELRAELPANGQDGRPSRLVLELIGLHKPGFEHPAPACPQCWEVFAALQVLGVYLMSRHEVFLMCEVDHYDQAIRYSPGQSKRPEVALKIRILQRGKCADFAALQDSHCVRQLQRCLLELGARPLVRDLKDQEVLT